MGFISVSCELDSNLLQDFDLSEFEGLSTQREDEDAAAHSDSEEPQVSSRHPNASFRGKTALLLCPAGGS